MPQIIPIKDLKDTSAVSDLCHRSDAPVFVTKNGYGDMVLMSIELFDSMQKQWRVYEEIEKAESDIAQGKVMQAREGLSSVRAKYGL
ncbi:MAG: type II toxin-antitoxin system Phd/YefM family antitoxin [Selenomonas sp.]|nr:type II toxin-antitoxin system Phd/YefM family antitoxin [Selenomonas sp.]